MPIKHAFVSEKEDGVDETLVRPSNWNAEHTGLITVRKTADEIVNNSTTLQDDDHLFFSVGANEVWLLHVVLLRVSVSTAPYLHYAFAIPSGASINGMAALSFVSSGTLTDLTVEQEALVATTVKFLQFIAIYVGGASAGTVQLQWAQGYANAEDTTLKANSLIIAHKLG